MSTDPIRGANLAPEDSPTTELVTGVVGDRCPNCQSPMAADQRYCLNCGERRGRARFSPAAFAPTATAAATEELVSTPHRPRFSSGATLVAGVATLLIAMGVGVLIGHDSSNTPTASKTPIINVGGGGTASTTASNTPTTGTKKSTGKAPKGKVAKPTVVHVTAKTAKAANTAASKVLGNSKNLSKNVQQSIGGSCSGGAGCQNGKFTGNFFPTG